MSPGAVAIGGFLLLWVGVAVWVLLRRRRRNKMRGTRW